MIAQGAMKKDKATADATHQDPLDTVTEEGGVVPRS
jgi:hypothetical protein